MKKFLSTLYTIFLFLFIFPTGTFFHIPVKTIAIAILLFVYILYKRRIFLDELTVAILFILLGVALWSLYGIINGFLGSTIKFDLNFVSLFVVIYITYEFYKSEIIDSKKILKYVSIVSFLIIVFNVMVSAALSTHIFDFDSFYSFYSRFFNAAPMTALINLGPITIYRVQMANNTIPFIWLGYTLVMDRRIIYKLFVVLMVGVLAVVSFSRVLIAEYLGLILASFVIRLLHNSKKTKDEAISIGFVSVVVILVFGFAIFRYGGVVIEYIETRFNSNMTEYSDSFRDIQKVFLSSGFAENPLLGHGAGSYVREYIRSDSAPYSYELEYLSFFYQFGILGFLWIIVGSMLIFYRLCLSKADNWNIKLLVLVNLIIWSIKPLYNPNFLSSNSGIIISIIFIYSHQIMPSKKVVETKQVVVNKEVEAANT